MAKITKVYESNNQFLVSTTSFYCENLKRCHNSNHVWFHIVNDTIIQKCFCTCETLKGRHHGFCKDFRGRKHKLPPKITDKLYENIEFVKYTERKPEKKQEEDRTTQMEEQGKYKELNAELRTENEKLKEKNNFYIEQEAKERESLLESLSDNDKTIYGDLPTDKLKQHVSNIVTKTTVRTDKSQPIRGNNFDKDIWAMEDKDKKSNWTDYIRSLTKKS